jgi:hypothetical protein
MSQHTLHHKSLVPLLDNYCETFDKVGIIDEVLVQKILTQVPLATDPEEFRLIASQLWDKYFCVDSDLMVCILRRWLEIEPQSREAKLALGNYLLAHGPDWDAEANRLVQEAG